MNFESIFGQGKLGSCCNNTWCRYNGITVLDITLVNVISRNNLWKMVIINYNHNVFDTTYRNLMFKCKYNKENVIYVYILWLFHLNELFYGVLYECNKLFNVYFYGECVFWFTIDWLVFVLIFFLNFFSNFCVFYNSSACQKWLEDVINHQLLLRLFVFEASVCRLRR